MLITFDSKSVIHLINKLPTAQQRINARQKIKEITSKAIDDEISKYIDILRDELRHESESIKRDTYARISSLEISKLKMNAGEYGF